MRETITPSELFTYYYGDKELVFNISDRAIFQNNSWLIFENELAYIKRGYDVEFFINNRGELLVRSEYPDAFFIDDEGGLMMAEAADTDFLSVVEGDLMVEEDNIDNFLIAE